MEESKRAFEDSPGSNAGRGLKQGRLAPLVSNHRDSPGSNAGRGLKHADRENQLVVLLIRPAAMPGVD